ncbi:hypothetical protein GLOIN_2v1740002 [Rhizophagus irregularis DAOM 181602=DAOM 197198]|uniref:Uncharacterized protein n=1 Tax=Rhizophagus irregularis (strain DAOM 181602 / DAOM 197198 / MUCL 43194) TaxID=747089 RepID=A0A2P4NMU8_RHIID|nr:hypothetical protein GLOIN_2v1740002 [Rhizophagus irregularis DAOM 181602=DAOM 197198]POG54464.1 hypothetical protein GLOIN_2v1740002 [Rhizophagus irregularis DAOM 181602=DAOM 197198]|eukprot:XP_025164229.1 hypothetical protein GLOIN_2v1740002 [Rhizophagus irregularis DAOM 181602=DAOM 197198]
MGISFNCYVLSSSDTFTIDIYKEEDIRYTMLGDNKFNLTVFKIGNILNFICSRNKVDVSVMRGVKLWKVNVKKSEIKKNVHTEEDIININGREMEPEELFEEYFQDELNNNNQNFKVSNIHVIAIIPPTGNTGDLRKTFPHVDDVDLPFFRKLAQSLAVIWDRSHDFSFETPNNPYVKLKQSPSIFKTPLPYGVTKRTCDRIDLCLPPFEVNTEMTYKNPLYHEPQFLETVRLVRNKIKKYEQDIIVLAGVTGGGKTSTTFAIAAELWAVHIDCSNFLSEYNNQLSDLLGAVRAKTPPFNDTTLQEWALRQLDIDFVSRMLILVKMYVEQKIKTPKDWLLAQLYSLDKKSINLICENLSELSTRELSILIHFINQCLKIERILFIQDEAQCLCRPEYGEYTGSNETNKPWNFLQAYTNHMIAFKFEVTHIISGTNMHMSSGISLDTSVGKEPSRAVHLVLKLPYLSPDDVTKVLDTVINMEGVSPETLLYLGNILKGRPRNCASFLKMLAYRSELLKDKDDEMVKTSKKWIEKITMSMISYLRNTDSTLAIGGVDPRKAIVDLVCCGIINSTSAGAELLRHGILPIQSPTFITLNSEEIDFTSIKINLELESYFITAIGKYFMLDNNATLTDIYVSHILERLGSPQSFGNELDGAFASAIIEKCGRNVLEELKKWTDDLDPHFKFPEWITPGMQFVTETNLSKAVPLDVYVKDIYQTTKYHTHAIQPPQNAGSDLVLCLVDKSNESNNVVLLSLSSAIYDENVTSSKYMEEKKEEKKEKKNKKRSNNEKKSRPQNKKMKLNDQNDGEEGCKPQKRVIVVDDNDDDDDSDQNDLNYDLDYDKTLKGYKESKTANVTYNRKCIHILVELPHRALSKRPNIFRYDKKGNLIVIVDNRNVKQARSTKSD